MHRVLANIQFVVGPLDMQTYPVIFPLFELKNRSTHLTVRVTPHWVLDPLEKCHHSGEGQVEASGTVLHPVKIINEKQYCFVGVTEISATIQNLKNAGLRILLCLYLICQNGYTVLLISSSNHSCYAQYCLIARSD